MDVYDIIIDRNTLLEMDNGGEYVVIHTIIDDGFEMLLRYGSKYRNKIVIPIESIRNAKVKPDGSVNIIDVDDTVVNLRFYKFISVKDYVKQIH